jgi:glycosyltransferase involved in cell wall biosynthesis
MTWPHVLFVSHMGAISGAEQVLIDVASDWPQANAFLFQAGPLADRLQSKHLTVTIPADGADLSSIRRDRSALSAIGRIGPLIGLIRAIARDARSADVVYANSQKAFTLSALAGLITRRPLVWHLHDIMDAAHFGAMQRRMQIALANRFADAVIVPSEATAAAFHAAGGRTERVTVVANGRDLVPLDADKATLRSRLDLPTGPLVGVFSRLAPWKGQDVLIEALGRVPDVRAIIVGSAMFGETDFEARLQAQVERLGLGDRIRFLGRREDVAPLMQAVDAVIHPSVDPEPFGLTLVEAMALGTPVIASATGAISEILADGRFSYLVPPGDVAALATMLASVIASPNAAMIAAARERARTLYSVSTMQTAIRAIIETVARRSHA